MKILVCIKQVPNTTEITIDYKTGNLIRDGVIAIFNPDDKHALEEALQLKDKYNAHVTVVSMGPPQAEEILRESMAMGADTAILVSDKNFAGSDTWATAKVLAKVAQKIEADVIFTGRQAIDGDTAQVGPSTAEFLKIPYLTCVRSIEAWDEKKLTVKRSIEGAFQIIKISTPCLFTVAGGFNKPRYMGAGYSRPLITWTAKDLDLSLEETGIKGSPTRVVSVYPKVALKSGEVIEANPDHAVDLIIKHLKEHRIIKEA
ncbi:MAG: electron transfer flavoprotein subunit beta/FixA family protein [Brevinema sp.]